MAKQLSKKKRRARTVKRFFTSLLIFALIAVFVRLLVFDTIKLSSDAMSPTYRKNDVVAMMKFDVLTNNNISRNDVVTAFFEAADAKLVRRVCGVPGDYIEVREDGSKYLIYEGENGTLYEKKLENAPALVNGTLPDGAYLLLSDNPDAQADDSRTLGLVYITDITAKAGTVLWPPSRMFRS